MMLTEKKYSEDEEDDKVIRTCNIDTYYDEESDITRERTFGAILKSVRGNFEN